jgi:hypothetical protein
MRLIKVLLLFALVMAGLATPALADPPPREPTGWSFDGSTLVWRSPARVPVGDAVIEFWQGDQPLGRPRPSSDHRTFTLDAAHVTDPGALAVRAGGRRLDVTERPRRLGTPPAQAPAPQPAGDVDPGLPGKYATRTGEYALDSIDLPGYPAPVEMKAVVVAPTGAPGRRPLALFLHGRHLTCYDPADPDGLSIDWPCPDGLKAIPSYRGYLQAQRLLASQGYVTVSISANGINGQDAFLPDAGAQGRSSLVRQHLAHWADWAGAGRRNAPDIVRDSPVADLSKVLLVGHSRGGEGVNRAATDSISVPPGDTGYDGPVRWHIRGTLLIGPTIFGHNPAPDVPSATILPGCDGDVSDLQGQMYVDATRGISRGAALHSALYVVGANHNYFNTEWTPGQSEAPSNDDWYADDDPLCGTASTVRLTPAQQQTVGATYIAAAARLFVAGDRRVLPLLDGSGVRAPSADPAHVLSHAVGGARTPFVVPDATTTADGDARVCQEVTKDISTMCVDLLTAPRATHFSTMYGVFEDPDRFAVALTGPGTVRPAKPVSLAGSDQLALRLAVLPNSTDNRFDVAITDTHGRRAALGSVAVTGLPGTELTSALWAQEVRVPLPHNGIDLRSVASLEVSGGSRAWLIDASGWRTGLPDPRPVALPRVDLGTLTVDEGDSGTRTYEVPASVSGNGAGTVRLFLSDETGVMLTSRLVTVHSGQHALEVPVDVTGNTRWSEGASYRVLAKPLRGLVSGAFAGVLTVTEDDPAPTITITGGTAAEGGALTWTATASAVADATMYRFGAVQPPGSGADLSTTDIDPRWFVDNTGEEPEPSRPLSTTPLFVMMTIEPGELTTELTIPTVADDEVEPTEYVRFSLESWPESGTLEDLVGTVTDQ